MPIFLYNNIKNVNICHAGMNSINGSNLEAHLENCFFTNNFSPQIHFCLIYSWNVLC
jgi:hypothetical protein